MSTGGSQLTTKVRVPTSFTVSVTLAPAGRPRATQSVVWYARFERHVLTPGGIDEFGVAVHVGVGPTRFCGGGMTVAVGVGGRGVGVGGDVVGGAGASMVGAEVSTATGMAVGVAVETPAAAGAKTPFVSPHATARRTTAMSATLAGRRDTPRRR